MRRARRLAMPKRRQKEPQRRLQKSGGSAKRAPSVIDGMATVVLSGARGLPNKYLKILRYKELRTEGTEGLVPGI